MRLVEQWLELTILHMMVSDSDERSSPDTDS